MFERRDQRLATWNAFRRRLIASAFVAALLIGVSLAIGILGYRFLAGMGWVDALLNASMILGGMGPVGDLPNPASKIFASFYALYSGIVLIATAGILLAPPLHRLMHRFHVEVEEEDEDESGGASKKQNARKKK